MITPCLLAIAANESHFLWL